MRVQARHLGVFHLALTACGIFDPTACTLIGCDDGLIVRLSALPTGPYRVEVFVGTPGQQPAHVYDCPTGLCGQYLAFPHFLPDRAWVRITTGSGVRTIEFPGIVYESHRPNGPDCPPTCRQATLMVELPG